jgi:hypothetical protein
MALQSSERALPQYMRGARDAVVLVDGFGVCEGELGREDVVELAVAEGYEAVGREGV